MRWGHEAGRLDQGRLSYLSHLSDRISRRARVIRIHTCIPIYTFGQQVCQPAHGGFIWGGGSGTPGTWECTWEDVGVPTYSWWVGTSGVTEVRRAVGGAGVARCAFGSVAEWTT